MLAASPARPVHLPPVLIVLLVVVVVVMEMVVMGTELLLLFLGEHFADPFAFCTILERELVDDLEYLLGLALFDLMRGAAQVDEQLLEAIHHSTMDDHKHHDALRTVG